MLVGRDKIFGLINNALDARIASFALEDFVADLEAENAALKARLAKLDDDNKRVASEVM